MPFPLPPAIAVFALAALDKQDIKGEGAVPLSKALSLSIGAALPLFLLQTKAAEGQPAAVAPTPAGLFVGATLPFGDLSGGLPPGIAIPLCTAAMVTVGLIGVGTPGLGEAVGASLSKALDLFVKEVKVGATGVAASATTPGAMLTIQSPPGDWKMADLVAEELDIHDIKGDGGKKLAAVLAETFDKTFTAMVPMVLVAPGIPVGPKGTAASGMLS